MAWHGVPCMCNDYVVERGMFLAEAGEAYFEDHCCAGCREGGGAKWFATMRDVRQILAQEYPWLMVPRDWLLVVGIMSFSECENYI
jgi:hypothetical protein